MPRHRTGANDVLASLVRQVGEGAGARPSLGFKPCGGRVSVCQASERAARPDHPNHPLPRMIRILGALDPGVGRKRVGKVDPA
jgi:hypothetical protein